MIRRTCKSWSGTSTAAWWPCPWAVCEKSSRMTPRIRVLLRQYTGSPLRPVAIHGRGAFVGLGLRHRAVARPPGAIAHKRTNHGGAGGRVAGLRSPALLPERDGRKPDAIHRLLSPPASELADVAALGQADPSGHGTNFVGGGRTAPGTAPVR